VYKKRMCIPKDSGPVGPVNAKPAVDAVSPDFENPRKLKANGCQ